MGVGLQGLTFPEFVLLILMVVIKTARQKLRNHTRHFGFTLDVCRDGCEFIGIAVHERWSDIDSLELPKQQVNHVEKLIRSTTKNKSSYAEFDKRFYKFPAYLRRAAISEYLGYVSSHMTRLAKWNKDSKGKPPAFQPKRNGFPVFYKGDLFKWVENGKVRQKLFNGNDWIWVTVPLDPIKTLDRFPASAGWTHKNPMLVQRGNRWMLQFPFEGKVSLQEKDFVRPVVSVDLGLTTTAVCSVLRSDGTVLHREFISYDREKDRLNNTLGFIAV